MPKRIKKISNILFMVSSKETIEKTAANLSLQARQAYTVRDFSEVFACSEKLLQLTPTHQPTGVYYKALALSNLGEIVIADTAFEGLINVEKAPIRAASFLALGMRQMQKGNYEYATKLIHNASTLALSGDICAPLTAIYAQNAMSVICGINGNSEQSLKILNTIEPLVKNVGTRFPGLLGQHWNAVAYENFQLGNVDLALNLSSKAISLSISSKYPEWRETFDEISAHLPSRSFVTVNKNNVFRFPIRQPVTETGEIIFRFNSKDYYLRDIKLDKINSLCQLIDAINAQSKKDKNSK
jgi:tetratricopeptide (TPR) repeat protein